MTFSSREGNFRLKTAVFYLVLQLKLPAKMVRLPPPYSERSRGTIAIVLMVDLLWRVTHNTHPMLRNIERNGIELDTSCVLYHRLLEDGGHLFF